MSFQDASKVINGLVRNAETLGALGAILGKVAGDTEPHPSAAEKYGAVQRAIDPNLFESLTQEEAQALRATIIARVRRALELVEAPDRPPTWAPDDPVVLQTQGKASRVVTQLISSYAERENAVASIFGSSTRFLDVGTGAGWISISMAERWPMLKADGLDIHKPALELATQNVRDAGLAERVAFRHQSVADLDEVDTYEAAFIPFIFIPETVLQTALPRLTKALRQGGWLFVACYREPDGELDRALWDLQTTMSGGRVWTADEVAVLVDEHGLSFVEDIGEGSPINLYATRKA